MKINKTYNGDALSVLRTFQEQSINMCVTSPPYWGLRDYGVDGQLGLESTFTEYINKLCNIFDEVKRVLKDNGTCWVNIGDSYNGSGKAGKKGSDYQKRHTEFGKPSTEPSRFGMPTNDKTIPKKSLIGIPFRFAIEMINRGWILRNTIIWHKPNCMPSSVKDRFTVDFEYLFFFSKNKKYYFEQQHEDALESSQKRYEYGLRSVYGDKEKYGGKQSNSVCDCERMGDFVSNPTKRNMRTVWKITTKPYKGAHFAVFPPELIETPIKAGCPENGIVLDPFMGSGTTGMVAKQLGKNYVGIELNPEYLPLIQGRVDNSQMTLG
jgi:site-specific DNA-methyltransferase (adenine-specific)